MDVLRRGWIGLALFFAALVLMPILVFGYDTDDSSARSTVTGSTSTAGGSAGSGRTPTPLAPAPIETTEPLSFAGVRQGEIISGFRAIRVETNGYGGPMKFVLNGPIPPYTLDLPGPPYVFTPHPGGWQTSEVQDGLYTVTAIPTLSGETQISISFTVSNGNEAAR